MSTSLHAIFDVVFSIVIFVLVILSIHGQKMQFSESSQISITEKSIFGQFGSFFSTYKLFQGWGWYFPVSTFQ